MAKEIAAGKPKAGTAATLAAKNAYAALSALRGECCRWGHSTCATKSSSLSTPQVMRVRVRVRVQVQVLVWLRRRTRGWSIMARAGTTTTRRSPLKLPPAMTAMTRLNLVMRTTTRPSLPREAGGRRETNARALLAVAAVAAMAAVVDVAQSGRTGSMVAAGARTTGSHSGTSPPMPVPMSAPVAVAGPGFAEAVLNQLATANCPHGWAVALAATISECFHTL